METKKQVKKRKLVHDDTDDVIPLCGHALKLMLQCLEPVDILKCVQTCRQWKREIDEEVWATVAKTSFPGPISAIEATKAEHGFKMDYRNMALCLSRRNPLDESETTEEESFPKPRLRPEDILAVVELREINTKKYLGAWSTPLTYRDFEESKYICFDFEENPINHLKLSATGDEVMEESLRDYPQFNPGQNVPSCILNNLEMTSRLIRLDSGNGMYGKSIFLNDFRKFDHNYHSNEGSTVKFPNSPDLKPSAMTVSGAIARELCAKQDYRRIWCVLDICMEPDKETLNQSQLEWIKNVDEFIEPFDLAHVELMPQIDESDRKKEFYYKTVAFALHFRVQDFRRHSWTVFKSVDDALLYFEGLEWK